MRLQSVGLLHVPDDSPLVGSTLYFASEPSNIRDAAVAPVRSLTVVSSGASNKKTDSHFSHISSGIFTGRVDMSET